MVVVNLTVVLTQGQLPCLMSTCMAKFSHYALDDIPKRVGETSYEASP